MIPETSVSCEAALCFFVVLAADFGDSFGSLLRKDSAAPGTKKQVVQRNMSW